MDAFGGHGKPAHFFAAAAEAMRRILIDNARRKRAVRHGGGQQRVDFVPAELASASDDDQLLAVNEALDKLAAQNKVQAELVKLRYFVGLTLGEAAEVYARHHSRSRKSSIAILLAPFGVVIRIV